MKSIKIALVAGALAVGVVPAAALAVPKYHPGGPEYHPSPPPHAKAYGVYCRGASKKHVKGKKGTPFSQCVKAMARADHNEKLSPGQACKGLSKDHVKGKKGTEFSLCVQGVAHLRRDKRREERETASSSAAHPTGPPAGTPTHEAGAYGRSCKGKSKEHVKGEQGTEFSRCVKAAAQQHREEEKDDEEDGS